MALAIDFSVCQEQCDEIKFTELTGIYSATNLGGYGTPNQLVSSFIDPKLFIYTLTNELVYEIDLPAQYPLNNDIDGYVITLPEVLPDGVYLVKYNITNNLIEEPDTYKSCYVLFTCQADCCVQKLYAKVTSGTCSECNESALNHANEAFGFLESAKASAACGDLTEAISKLNKVKYMCTSLNCKC